MKLDFYGAKLPNYKVLKYTANNAVIMLYSSPRNLVLNISVAQNYEKFSSLCSCHNRICEILSFPSISLSGYARVAGARGLIGGV